MLSPQYLNIPHPTQISTELPLVFLTSSLSLFGITPCPESYPEEALSPGGLRPCDTLVHDVPKTTSLALNEETQI